MAASDVVVVVYAGDPYFARGLALALTEHGLTGVLPDDEELTDEPRDEDGEDDLLIVHVREGAERRAHDTPAVWILDAHETPDEALAQGARAVVLRGVDAPALASAVRAVAHGFTVVDPRLSTRIASTGAASERKVERGPLTDREMEVIALLAQGLTNKEIAAELRVSAHTAKFHVNGILEKLGAMTRTEAVTIAVRSGFLHL